MLRYCAILRHAAAAVIFAIRFATLFATFADDDYADVDDAA